MADRTGISWCDHTMNFWIGCQKVSAACDGCYAETWAARWPRYAGAWSGNRYRTGPDNWKQPYRWNRAAARDGVRRLVFSNSLSDFFDKAVDPGWHTDAWKVIRDCDDLIWLLELVSLARRGLPLWRAEGRHGAGLWRHRVRGTIYRILGTGRIQCPAAAPMQDDEMPLLYMDINSGGFGIRRPDEFHDGRFERIVAAARHGGDA